MMAAQPYVLGDLDGFQISRIFQFFQVQHGVPVLLEVPVMSAKWFFQFSEV